jgi:hypothetical protein
MVYDNEAGAGSYGLAHGHSGVDAEGAGGVGAGGDHSAGGGVAADGKGFAFEGGVVEFFYGAEEGIEVEVKDGAWHMFIVALFF